MKSYHAVLFIFCLFALTRCDKTTPFTIDVSAITSTDALGNPIGTTDNTDWTEDVDWTETEKSFFMTDPVDMTGAEVATVNLQPAYPNPCQNQIALQFTVSKPTYLRIAIVDEQLKKLSFYEFLTDGGLNAYNIPFNPSVFSINKNYRIYYTFNAPGNEMYYKGHGDVAVR